MVAICASVEEVVEALETGEDERLLGLQESVWFDAKSSPYQLDEAKQAWELAKDVSAMANEGGGIIVIGAKTERKQGSLVEYVSKVKPIPADHLMAADRVHDVLRSRLWPPQGARVEVRDFERSGGCAIQAIIVEPAPDDEKPVLTRSRAVIEGEGKSHEIDAWGSARRVGSGTEWEPVEKLWADIRDGRVARKNLSLPETSPGPPVSEHIDEMVEVLGERIALGTHAALVLIARPDRSLDLRGFFRQDGLRGSLSGLPDSAVRRSGFGLGYGLSIDSIDNAMIVAEVGRRGLLLGRDGILIAMALATPDMLGWAAAADADPVPMNRFVLVEWPLEFARFVEGQLAPRAPDVGWVYEARGVRLLTGEPSLTLSTADRPFGFAQPPLVDSPRETVEWSGDAEMDAYHLVDEIAGWFSLDDFRHSWIVDGRVSTEGIRTYR